MYFKKCLFVFSTIVICASAAHFLEQEWNLWKSKYGKQYDTEELELYRQKAWLATRDLVKKHNQLAELGLKNYTLAMNQFADLTPEERASHISLGLKEKVSEPRFFQNRHRNLTVIPKKFDWRKTKCVTPVKSQGECGSCWAFATVGLIETRYCLDKGKQLLFSEQQLVDCDKSNYGCDGGLPINALEYVSKNGIMKSDDYKYEEQQSKCLFNSNNAIKMRATKFFYLSGEEDLATSVATNGPVTAGIGVNEEFMLYEKGIYDGSCAGGPNHAIIIEGYGRNYWIVRNSWGDEWGEGGYVRMKRNVNQCSIAVMPATMEFTFL
ncbi:cathepsin S-like [Pelobates cultripes]|uniref:Cathepsin S-like n=1 Tax=Pelobates cultripes TaxID=61616 RepID=A0AAD1VXW5_PELCU|nr:cathepsin S-like [Pelobates cultripes]